MLFNGTGACLPTQTVEVMILDPPDAPDMNLTVPLESSMMVGLMEDCGIFPGWMKLAEDGSNP